jgi:DNA primase
MSAARLLERLESVREVGADKWIARCPAHDDKHPSLSICETDDGRVLVHCFAGCAAIDIVTTVGLQLSDLFPERLGHHLEPIKTQPRIAASDLLRLIDHETFVVWYVASHLLERKSLSEEGLSLLTQAARRIGEARQHVY